MERYSRHPVAAVTVACNNFIKPYPDRIERVEAAAVTLLLLVSILMLLPRVVLVGVGVVLFFNDDLA